MRKWAQEEISNLFGLHWRTAVVPRQPSMWMKSILQIVEWPEARRRSWACSVAKEVQQFSMMLVRLENRLSKTLDSKPKSNQGWKLVPKL